MKRTQLLVICLLAVASLFFNAACSPKHNQEVDLNDPPHNGQFYHQDAHSDPEKIRIAIERMTFDTDKVEHIRNYKDSVTDNIKLSMVTSILKEFTHDSEALKALDLLKHKISKDYSEQDLKEFTKVFSFSGSITEAMRLLNTE